MIDYIKKYNNFKHLDVGFLRKKYLDLIKGSIGVSSLIKVIIGQRKGL